MTTQEGEYKTKRDKIEAYQSLLPVLVSALISPVECFLQPVHLDCQRRIYAPLAHPYFYFYSCTQARPFNSSNAIVLSLNAQSIPKINTQRSKIWPLQSSSRNVLPSKFPKCKPGKETAVFSTLDAW